MSAKDRTKAKTDRTKGHLKETLGRVTGNRRTQNEGHLQKVKGELHDAVTKARHAAERKHHHKGR